MIGCDNTRLIEAKPRRSGWLHRDRRRKHYDLPERAGRSNDCSDEAQRGGNQIKIGTLGEDQEWEVKEVAEYPRQVDAEPSAGDGADDDA